MSLAKVESAPENGDPELVEVLVAVNRVAKVVKGGRRFGFSAVVIMGDGKGRVGYGLGKAKEVTEALAKATHEAKKHLKKYPLKENRTVHHDVIGQFGAGRVLLRTAPQGCGIIAGGPMRAIFTALGINDIVAKSLGSNNVHNMVGATFDALSRLTSPRNVAERRGKKVGELFDKKATKEKESE